MQILNEYALYDFAKESNDIEGISGFDSNDDMTRALKCLIYKKKLTLENIVRFAFALDPKCVLRAKAGMDVRIGAFIPQRGGEALVRNVEAFLELQNNKEHRRNPFEAYIQFETFHPFMDGNGRTGRAIWLWQMLQEECYNDLGFLRIYHYQSFDAFRDSRIEKQNGPVTQLD